jgi:hypothetical protein
MIQRVRLTVGTASWDVFGIALAGLLSAYAIALTTGVIPTGHPHGSLGAALGVLFMTVPVLWARRSPVVSSVILGVAAPLNVVAFGSLVRCGATLPAVFYVAFCLGLSRWQWRSGVGALFLVGSLVSQTICDPRLGVNTLPVFAVIALIFYVCGRLVAERHASVMLLRARRDALLDQIEQTASLAVAIERELVAVELDQALVETLQHITILSGQGLEFHSHHDVDASMFDARAAFVNIEESGRQALSNIRRVLTRLHQGQQSGGVLVE